MPDFTPIIDQLITIIYGALGILGAFALAQLRTYLKARGFNERVDYAIESALTAADVAVRRVSQELVPMVREAAADGKIDAEEREKLVAEALRLCKLHIGPIALAALKDALSLDDESLDDYLRSLVEAAVVDMKRN